MERIRHLEAEVLRLQHKSIRQEEQENFIKIFHANRLVKLLLTDVLFIRAESNYSRIFLRSGEQFYTSKTLKCWMTEISDVNFIRCHRSFLINRKEIIEIDKGTHEILMKGGEHIPTSRRFQKVSVKAAFQKDTASVSFASPKPDCTVRKLVHLPA
ncbi:MAG: LytTR family transcriptional regulator [Saprospiraceae bacterium]|uniref:LytTR family transcriptional regulator n=1 Tax=Candidatus Opimibacter skivensis TaxID=2982028 RepID=A0A9D7SVT0_9BACT|nr:LytTR family transcriptional regulator [Candidatus Opimibacter skivensis]